MNSSIVLSSLLGVNKQYVEMSKQMLLHYSQWPINEFVLTLNGSESDIWYFRQFVCEAGLPATVFSTTAPYDNRRQARWSSQRQSYISRRYSPHDWKLCVDSDEILERSDALLRVLDATTCAYFLAFTVDMLPVVPPDETLGDAQVFDRPHLKCFLTQAYALAQKVPLARAHVLVGGAGHDVGRRYRALPRFDHILPLFHYKWEAGVRVRLLRRFEHYRQLGVPYAEESLLYYRRLREGVGDLVVADLDHVRFAMKRDKTGGTSLQIDPAGHLTFFTCSKWQAGGDEPV